MPGRILRWFEGDGRKESDTTTADKTILKLETSELHQAQSEFRSDKHSEVQGLIWAYQK